MPEHQDYDITELTIGHKHKALRVRVEIVRHGLEAMDTQPINPDSAKYIPKDIREKLVEWLESPDNRYNRYGY